jgi:hypothetical protein
VRPVAFNDRSLFIGKTLSGKSTLARWFWGQMIGARRVCVNVKGSPGIGVPPVFDVGAIDWTAPVVNYVPREITPKAFEDLYAAILEHGGATNVWLDEAYGPTTGSSAAPSLIRVQTQGASLGIGHTVCSQRPKDIAVPLRTEAEHIFMVVPPISYDDLGALAREVSYIDGQPCGPRELADMLREVQQQYGDHAAVWWQRGTGEIVVMEPLPPEEAHAPLPEAPAPSPQTSAPDESDVHLAAQQAEGPELEEQPDA